MPDQPTPAELRALVAFAIHGDYQAAADSIGVSRNTLRNTLVTLRQKMGVTSSIQALHLAIELGYVTVRRRDAA